MTVACNLQCEVCGHHEEEDSPKYYDLVFNFCSDECLALWMRDHRYYQEG